MFELTVSEETLVSAFRYSIGRKSYVVGTVVSDIASNAESLSADTRKLIIKEISDRWAVDELGHPNDKSAWVSLLQQLQDIEEAS